MRLVTWFVIACGLIVSFAGGVSAQVPVCDRYNTPGCIQLRVMAVDSKETARTIDPNGDPWHYVEGLLNGTFADSNQVAAAVFNLSSGKGSRRNDIKLVSGCVPHYVYVWGSNRTFSPGVRESSVQVGQGGRMPNRVPVQVPAGGFPQGSTVPDEVFRVEVCGGEAGLNIPAGYITENTFILICPEGASLFPKRTGGTAFGHHLTQEELRKFKAQLEAYGLGHRKVYPIMLLVSVF